MVKQSSIKTTTWADQAQGFDFPSKQHTARGGQVGMRPLRRHIRKEIREGTEIVMPPLMKHRAACGTLHPARMVSIAPTGQRREVYGRGGGRGRGRGQHRGPSTNYRGGASTPLPPLRHREYTEELHSALVPLLKLPVTHPITLNGPEYESFSSNEHTLPLLHIEAERGSKFWLGDKFDLADRWAFSHPEDIVAAINDQKIMQRAVSRFSVETDLFPQFHTRSSPLQPSPS
jgi:hypothetical protein